MSTRAAAAVTPRPAWAQRAGESFAAYVERFYGEIATPAELAALDEAAAEDRGDLPGAASEPSDAPDR